jgi:conjugal transfer pilus assembly protein TraF
MRRLFLALLMSYAAVVSATPTNMPAKPDAGSFYDDRQRGWYWFEEEPEEEIVEEPVQPAPPPVTEQPAEEKTPEQAEPTSRVVVIDAAWLRENLPQLKENALNDPSDRNLAAYYYAQRMAVDMSTRFAMRTREFFHQESQLSEEHRRPTKQFVLNQHTDSTRENRKEMLQSLFSQAGIWMFFLSDCSYCHEQTPVMMELARRYGADVLYVSLDGQVMSGHEDLNYRDDADGRVRSQLNIQISRTPTLFLVRNDGSEAFLLAEGMITLNELEQLLLETGRQSGWLSEDDYFDTQEVRNITTVESDEGTVEVEVSGDEASDGSEALVEMLKDRLSNFQHSSATKVED